MAIIGGIGNMPDTIEDRAVVIEMRRRSPGESVAQWRSRRAVPQLRALRGRLHSRVEAHQDELATAEPDLPAEDRAADVWESLVAVADAAGGDWPTRARQACKVLVAEGQPDPDTAGERLLGDLYDIWGDDEGLFTTAVIDRLCDLEEAPWATWHRGDRLTPRGLASLLQPWGVRSRNIRRPEGQAKGYYRGDLTDAWERYVLPARADPSLPSHRPEHCQTEGESRDGKRDGNGEIIRPVPEQQLFAPGDGGTGGTEKRPSHAPGATSR